MDRKQKLDRLLILAPTAGADIDLPEEPTRFVALEQDENGDTLWMYFGEHLDELRSLIAESETRFVEGVRVHDLDTDAVLTPVWQVERFAEIEGNFSYAAGYITVS